MIGPISVKPIHQQDPVILPETLTALVDCTEQIGIALAGSAITLDGGFDSQNNKDIIKAHHMQPVISPNRRHAKTPIAMARMFRWFDRSLYRLRFKVERTFGWQDTFRKLVISYDRLPEIRKGCRLLAYAMINFRLRSRDRPLYAFRGGFRGAGASSTESKITANIVRGFCPKKRSAAVVPSGRVRKKL